MNDKILNLLRILVSVVIALSIISWSLVTVGERQAMKTVIDDHSVVTLKIDGIGPRLAQNGAIDEKKWMQMYEGRSHAQALVGSSMQDIRVTEENADAALNMLWAFGLSNNNPVLTTGPMGNYGDVRGFASTGGWTLARGSSMNHFGAHEMVFLNAQQQKLLEDVSKNIYRPCCNNSTYLPDCNHGMAMLGVLELMASQNVSEREMYNTAYELNRLWFPSHYETVEHYLKKKNSSIQEIGPELALSASYSSAQGFERMENEVSPAPSRGGGGCSV